MGFGRLASDWLRPKVRTFAVRILVPTANRTAVQPTRGRVTVAGLLSSASGLGEGARLCAGRLAELGYVVGSIDLTPICGLPGGVPFAHPMVASHDVGGPLLIHLNPPVFQVVLARHLRRQLEGRMLIGYWAWEAPDVPVEWRAAFRLVHEIWVPSRFVADALSRAGCQVPPRVVPHPLRIPIVPAASNRTSQDLKILTILAYDSGFERKNPIAAVDAFRSAFGVRRDVTLIIKTRGRSTTGEPEARLQAAIADSPNIRLVHGDLTPDEYAQLLDSADILLSLHRSEGFGIPCAEMMLRAKPVIATAWSGNLDFMSEDTACLVPARLIRLTDDHDAYRGLDSVWAEPSVTHAAAWLRRLCDPALRSKIGNAARMHAAECLSGGVFTNAVEPVLGKVAVECMK
jgi:glycosyltransferase involved in cell wall biosynthesis